MHVQESQFLPFVLTNKLVQLLRVLNLVQTLDELVCEGLNPLDVFLLHFEQSVPDLGLPLGYDMDVWRVLFNRLGRVFFNALILFHLFFVLLVDVVQVLFGHEALEALVFLEGSRPERGWGVVLLTVDAQSAVRELLSCIHQECIIDDFLTNVALHEGRCFLILLIVDESKDDLECSWVIFANRQFLCLALWLVWRRGSRKFTSLLGWFVGGHWGGLASG